MENTLDLLSLVDRTICKDLEKPLFLFDGKNWTGNVVEISDDDKRLTNEFCQLGIKSWFQLTVIKNSQKERYEKTQH